MFIRESWSITGGGDLSMDDPNTTTANRDQTDEDLLTYTVSDKALEAAAAMKSEPCTTFNDPFTSCFSDDFGVPECASSAFD
jgi:hypothetical protein